MIKLNHTLLSIILLVLMTMCFIFAMASLTYKDPQEKKNKCWTEEHLEDAKICETIDPEYKNLCIISLCENN